MNQSFLNANTSNSSVRKHHTGHTNSCLNFQTSSSTMTTKSTSHCNQLQTFNERLLDLIQPKVFYISVHTLSERTNFVTCMPSILMSKHNQTTHLSTSCSTLLPSPNSCSAYPSVCRWKAFLYLSLVPQAFSSSPWYCEVATQISDTITTVAPCNWIIFCPRIYAHLLTEYTF